MYGRIVIMKLCTADHTKMCKIYGTKGRDQMGEKDQGSMNNPAGKANILEVNDHSEH